MFSRGVIRIRKCYCERIGENGCTIMKRNAMLFSIHFRLFGVPLELHSFRPLFCIIHQKSEYVYEEEISLHAYSFGYHRPVTRPIPAKIVCVINNLDHGRPPTLPLNILLSFFLEVIHIIPHFVLMQKNRVCIP